MPKFLIKKHNVKVKKCRTGRGLFAAENIKKGICFLEYFGRELTEDEKYTSESSYLFEVNDRITIDGWAKGNIAKYINYACNPNAEFDTYKNKIYVLALRDITKGEEITINYGDEYFDEYIKPNGCLCLDCVK